MLAINRGLTVTRNNSTQRQCYATSVPETVLAKLSKEELQRQEVIFEVISTEKQYLTSLTILVEKFVKPIRENNFLTNDQFDLIFSNVEQLVPISQKLITKLESRKSESIIVSGIGDIFVGMIPEFESYSIYCANQSSVFIALPRFQSRNEQFNNFLTQVATKQETLNLQLTDFLIQPMQRICKYPLLFRELIKSTNESHPDYFSLKTASDLIIILVEKINSKAKKFDSVMKLEQLEKILLFPTPFELFSGKRFLKLEVCGKLLKKNNTPKRDIKLYLFNDILLLCSSILTGTFEYQVEHTLSLTSQLKGTSCPIRAWEASSTSVQLMDTVQDKRWKIEFSSSELVRNFLSEINQVGIAKTKIWLERRRNVNGTLEREKNKSLSASTEALTNLAAKQVTDEKYNANIREKIEKAEKKKRTPIFSRYVTLPTKLSSEDIARSKDETNLIDQEGGSNSTPTTPVTQSRKSFTETQPPLSSTTSISITSPSPTSSTSTLISPRTLQVNSPVVSKKSNTLTDVISLPEIFSRRRATMSADNIVKPSFLQQKQQQYQQQQQHQQHQQHQQQQHQHQQQQQHQQHQQYQQELSSSFETIKQSKFILFSIYFSILSFIWLLLAFIVGDKRSKINENKIK
eukprot:TRINITY_DN2183_c0_g3_i4.p1 TRINITY_DN2183_c0_g3~~TRINITY_DN2183_c0_g3_i4.p1  ORF type:complete len:632 (-),score=215.87 TRINITY_DN2183_c0_g3_i4:61-1956(-)